MKPPVWILSGVSCAGKATALAALEVAGAECVDNLPVDLIEAFVAVPRERAAVAVLDARQGRALDRFTPPPGVQVLFLDARDDVVVRRLAETTRPHPCSESGRGMAAVAAERVLLEPMRAAADVVIDTSETTAEALRGSVVATLLPRGAGEGAAAVLVCTVSSFGFKFGPQLDADWIVDTRFLRNPFWDPALRPLSGLDPPVRDYVLGTEDSTHFIDGLAGLLGWTAGRVEAHGRRSLHIAVGCTGGRHRSVVVATELGQRLTARGVTVRVRHRDIDRPDLRSAAVTSR